LESSASEGSQYQVESGVEEDNREESEEGENDIGEEFEEGEIEIRKQSEQDEKELRKEDVEKIVEKKVAPL
jgi:hypothetical protein